MRQKDIEKRCLIFYKTGFTINFSKEIKCVKKISHLTITINFFKKICYRTLLLNKNKNNKESCSFSIYDRFIYSKRIHDHKTQ